MRWQKARYYTSLPVPGRRSLTCDNWIRIVAAEPLACASVLRALELLLAEGARTGDLTSKFAELHRDLCTLQTLTTPADHRHQWHVDANDPPGPAVEELLYCSICGARVMSCYCAQAPQSPDSNPSANTSSGAAGSQTE